MHQAPCGRWLGTSSQHDVEPTRDRFLARPRSLWISSSPQRNDLLSARYPWRDTRSGSGIALPSAVCGWKRGCPPPIRRRRIRDSPNPSRPSVAQANRLGKVPSPGPAAGGFGAGDLGRAGSGPLAGRPAWQRAEVLGDYCAHRASRSGDLGQPGYYLSIIRHSSYLRGEGPGRIDDARPIGEERAPGCPAARAGGMRTRTPENGELSEGTGDDGSVGQR